MLRQAWVLVFLCSFNTFFHLLPFTAITRSYSSDQHATLLSSVKVIHTHNDLFTARFSRGDVKSTEWMSLLNGPNSTGGGDGAPPLIPLRNPACLLPRTFSASTTELSSATLRDPTYLVCRRRRSY